MKEILLFFFNNASSICLAISLIYIISYFVSVKEIDFVLFAVFTFVIALQQLFLDSSFVFQYAIVLFLLVVSIYSLTLAVRRGGRKTKIYYLYFAGGLLLSGLIFFDLMKSADYVYGEIIRLSTIGAILWAVIGGSVVLTYVHETTASFPNGSIHIINAKEDVEDKGTLDITDPLTGLYNDEFFRESIEEEVKDSIKMNRSLSLLITDVDEFDKIFGYLGKSITDHILSEISAIIKNTIKEGDFPARYGDARFAIILPNTKVTGAFEVGERILKRVCKVRFVIEGKPDVFVTMSSGITELRGSDMTEDLVSRALNALESAKRVGGDRITVKK